MVVIKDIKENWFLIGIVLVILAAKLSPKIGVKGGVLVPEVTVKYVAVSVIFFNSGLSLKTEQLTGALFQVRVHMFVQLFTFVCFPLLMQAVVFLLQLGTLDTLLLEGLTILSCMPPPVSSAVILTKAAGGNEAAAVFNSAFGSFLGIVITPTLVLASIGSAAHVPASTIFLQLTSTVVLPLVIGQIVRAMYRQTLERNHVPFGNIGSVILLLIIYTTFCDTFAHEDIKIDQASLISTVLLIIIFQMFLMLLVFYTSTWSILKLQPSDCVALLFCCTHKSLTLGIPIIKIIFGGYDGLSVITIPLLVYHPTQILLGGLLVPTIRSWLITAERFRR
ncbi:sodium/bile acid cotransporter 7-A-like isoform X2 [Gigantopelta aegis]|uniref:sodium/bile acid cotransporter 7-A-like isoform X2 n=1 Tax=Gigantopelta aegis TaxID=1735272 RepID=UPI001B889FFC|nr:sodium/bile acid cotransporter 7-A-like isoform X2 [Gigantopelta aegis]